MNNYLQALILLLVITSTACTSEETICPDYTIPQLKLTFTRANTSDSTKSLLVYINDKNYNPTGSLDFTDTIYEKGGIPTSINIPLNANSDSTTIQIDFTYIKSVIDSIAMDTLIIYDTIISYDTNFVSNDTIIYPDTTFTIVEYQFIPDTNFIDKDFLVYDTVQFIYSKSLLLNDIDCDFEVFFNLFEIKHTENYIISAPIITPLINQDSENNVEIYF